MGLLDSVLGGALGSGQAGGGDNPVMRVITSLLEQHGGLAGLLDLLKQHGLDRQVASWVGTGENLPVDAGQIIQSLGNGPLAELAGKFGMQPDDLAGKLAGLLPGAVDQLTPGGQIPAGDKLLEQGLGALAGKLFG